MANSLATCATDVSNGVWQLVTRAKDAPKIWADRAFVKRGIYQLTDHYFRFWFEFVFPDRSDLESGDIDTVLKKIKQGFPLLYSL